MKSIFVTALSTIILCGTVAVAQEKKKPEQKMTTERAYEECRQVLGRTAKETLEHAAKKWQRFFALSML